jgi:hypothetical protein
VETAELGLPTVAYRTRSSISASPTARRRSVRSRPHRDVAAAQVLSDVGHLQIAQAGTSCFS